MASGFKVRKVETHESYTIEELYEHIRCHSFTAGKPSLCRQGVTCVITFPPFDSNQQIWITQAQLGSGPYCKWQVYKNEPLVSDKTVSSVSRPRMGKFFSSRGQKIRALIEITADELTELGL